jgi:hypothetical protein
MVKDRISDENAYEMVVIVPTGYWWQGYCLVKTIYALLRSELVWFNVLIKTGKKEMGIMVCLEVWRGRRVEGKGGRSGEGRRGKGNGYPFPLFGCFKF